MRTRNRGFGENGYTNFPWEDQGILHGRDDGWHQNNFEEDKGFLASWQAGEKIGGGLEAHMLCMQVEKSWEDPGDVQPTISDIEQSVGNGHHTQSKSSSWLMRNEWLGKAPFLFSAACGVRELRAERWYTCRDALPRLRDDRGDAEWQPTFYATSIFKAFFSARPLFLLLIFSLALLVKKLTFKMTGGFGSFPSPECFLVAWLYVSHPPWGHLQSCFW